MPGWLLFVISGILAGGIPGFCRALLLLAPAELALVRGGFFSSLCLGDHHHDTQVVIMHGMR